MSAPDSVSYHCSRVCPFKSHRRVTICFPPVHPSAERRRRSSRRLTLSIAKLVLTAPSSAFAPLFHSATNLACSLTALSFPIVAVAGRGEMCRDSSSVTGVVRLGGGAVEMEEARGRLLCELLASLIVCTRGMGGRRWRKGKSDSDDAAQKKCTNCL